MDRFFEQAAEIPATTRPADSAGDLSHAAGMVVVGPPLARERLLGVSDGT
jgi:hypothetical protein